MVVGTDVRSCRQGRQRRRQHDMRPVVRLHVVLFLAKQSLGFSGPRVHPDLAVSEQLDVMHAAWSVVF